MKKATLCYIRRIPGGEYLMLYRNKKKEDPNEGKWLGIGGKVEEGETPDECLLREVREETGLTLTRYRYRGLVTFVSNQWETEYMHLYTADGFTGEQVKLDTRECGLVAPLSAENAAALRAALIARSGQEETP